MLITTAVGGALLWPPVLNYRSIVYPCAAPLGGVVVGVHRLMMAVVGSRFGAPSWSVPRPRPVAFSLVELVCGPGERRPCDGPSAHGLPFFALSWLACRVKVASSGRVR